MNNNGHSFLSQVAIWKTNADNLDKESSVDEITQQIDLTRLSVVNSLRHLR